MIYAIESNEFAHYLKLIEQNKLTSKDFFLILNTNNACARQALTNFLCNYHLANRERILELLEPYRNEEPNNYLSDIINLLLGNELPSEQIITILEKRPSSNKIQVIATILKKQYIWQNVAIMQIIFNAQIADLICVAHYLEYPYFAGEENSDVMFQIIKSPLKSKSLVYELSLIPELQQSKSYSIFLEWLKDNAIASDIKAKAILSQMNCLHENGILSLMTSELDQLNSTYFSPFNDYFFRKIMLIFNIVSDATVSQIALADKELLVTIPLDYFQLLQRFYQLPMAQEQSLFRGIIKLGDLHLAQAIVELTKYPQVFNLPNVRENLFQAQNAKEAYEYFRTTALENGTNIFENSDFGYNNHTYVPNEIISYLNGHQNMSTPEILKLVPALTSDNGLKQWLDSQK